MVRSHHRAGGRPVWIVSTLLLAAVTLAACAGSSAAPILSNVGGQVVASPAARPANGDGTGAGGAGATTAPGNNAQAPVDDAKIVRTGTLQLQVGEIGPAVDKARAAVRELGGYIGASRATNDGNRSVASVTYRIPSDRWDDALSRIKETATKVITEETAALEVTGQVVDLGARIDNLRASERALQAIVARATKISDILEVEGQLTQVRGQIEQLTAQLTHLQDQASYGTLTVTFGLEVQAVVEAAKNWDPASEVDRATAQLVDMGQALTSAGIWFLIVWLPILAFVGIFLLLALAIRRRMALGGRGGGSSIPPLPPAEPPVVASGA
jgi:hypothetical protein